jgi:hypothetical protein
MNFRQLRVPIIAATVSLAIQPAAEALADGKPAQPIHYQLVASRYPSSDSVVAAYTDADLKLDRTGRADSSATIQTALTAIGAAGGGTLFLSAGTYRLDSPLVVPKAVTLRGEIGATPDPYRYEGTVLAAYAGRGDATAPPLVKLTNDSGIRDCIVWYPEQKPDSIVPYPPSVNHADASTSVENVVFVNAYQAYRCGYHMTGRAYVRNLRATALSVGVEIDGLADTGRVEGVQISPEFWIHSGLPGSPGEHDAAFRDYLHANAIGIEERRIDWTNTADVEIEGCNKGYYTTYSINDEDLKKGHTKVAPNGENYNYAIRDCVYGVYLECTANSGLIFTHFNVQASKCGFYLGDDCSNIATLLDCAIDCPGTSIDNRGPGRIVMRDCRFRSGALNIASGVMSCVASTFAASACRIVAGDALVAATFAGDSFAAKPVVAGSQAAAPLVRLTGAPIAPAPPPVPSPIDFETHRGATAARLFVVTEPPFGAVADGKSDCGYAIRAALHAARLAGGGIVYVPAGIYLITGAYTIPAGVELRGAFGGPHDANTAGSDLLIADAPSSPSSTATVTIVQGGAIRGLNFHYANQDEANITDFPFLIRGQGAHITIANVASANVSRFADLMSYRCDDAFVDHLEGQPIHIGVEVGGGSRGVTVSDCQFNPSNWTFSLLFNSPKVLYGNDPVKRAAVNKAYTEGMQEHGEQYVLGDCAGLRFYRNFVFAGRYGVHCVAQNGHGPSGCCLELGIDASTTALRIDDIGAGGFPFINSQLVVVSNLAGQRHSIEIGDGFRGSALVYGANMWGGRTDSCVSVAGGNLILDGAHMRDPGNPAIDMKGGTVAMSASCVRRNPVALYSGAPGAVTLVGNIVPVAGAEAAKVDTVGNVAHTDADSLPKAAG